MASGTVDLPARVLLVDDHTLFRQGLRQALEEQGIPVIGEASNGSTGVKLAAELRPDVIVMDLHMPQMDGIEATRAIIAARPEARILMLTIASDEQEVLEALTAGACGYVLKNAAPQDVVQAIHAAHDGDSTLSPEVTKQLVARLRSVHRSEPAVTPPVDALTPREIEILRLLSEGKENHEIAETLFISTSTAKNHVAHVLDKLGLENRVQAAVYAVRSGIV